MGYQSRGQTYVLLKISYKILVEVVNMMQKETELRLDNGLSQTINMNRIYKQQKLVNIIMVKSLVDGISKLKINLSIIKNKLKYFSGGELYDGGGMKIGKWIEIRDVFEWDSQITYNGEYKNDKKIGRWNILYRYNSRKEFEQIGGGSYHKQGDGIKVGKWIELSNQFDLRSQVIYNGEYQNGKKIGRWDILQRDSSSYPFEQIGGGSYDEGGDEIKIGQWIELTDNFGNRFWNKRKVTFNGEYKQGKKFGIWVTMDIENDQKLNEMKYDL
ncbi:unnamed protein product [Paramecium pentaurelia]|uniref:MORN repeat protein n=1 Tax=Paramecium pentaurelia TaxID=43138 RepID=A0A8S1XMZ0_9CILI|nr:unnamed protein product [Paramecium pentaurelia]